MSEILAIKLKTREKFDSNSVSDMLFDIAREGCDRKIAIYVLTKGTNFYGIEADLSSDELVILLFDSYNRKLTSPLICSKMYEEVREYRPEPLKQRLLNLQGFFEFVLNCKQVISMRVMYDETDFVFENTNMDIQLKDFAEVMTDLIDNAPIPAVHYEFFWTKQ